MTIELFPKQAEFVEAMMSEKYRYMLYGGAIRGGKSFTVLTCLFILCKAFPGSRWALVRKDLPTLRRNTLPSYEKIAPRPFVGDISRTTWTADCENGSQIIFFTENLRDDPDLDRWKGLEVNGFILDEATELHEASFAKAIERSGSWSVPDGNQPIPYVLMSCNPAQNWVKRRFYDRYKLDTLTAPYYYLPASYKDNPHLDPEYVRSLEMMKESDPAAYDRFVLGNWEAADDPDQLIIYAYIKNCIENTEPDGGVQWLAIDVARFGDDSTVFAYYRGNELYDMQEWHGLSLDAVADRAESEILDRSIDPARVGVDAVGLGAGVIDILHAAGMSVKEIRGSDKPDDAVEYGHFSFRNLKAQMWWHFRERLRSGEIAITVPDVRKRQRLVEDLTAPKYRITSDERMIEVESKKSIKKRLGRSPDYGDAAVYGDWVRHIDQHWLINR